MLERAGLVRRETDGRLSRCELDAQPMRDAAEWVARYRRFWEEQLDSLSRYIDEQNRAQPVDLGQPRVTRAADGPDQARQDSRNKSDNKEDPS